MQDLHLILEYYTKGYEILTVYFLFVFAVFTSIFVIITKNPVLSVLFLILLFLIMSAYLMLLGASFIGLSYILVYVGAVSILFLFILMLINIRVSELISNTSNSLVLAMLVAYIFFATIGVGDVISFTSGSLSNYTALFNSSDVANDITMKFATTAYWDGNLTEISHISSIGNVIYTDFFLWLILSSVILLLAMIGAIIITIV